MTHPVTPREQDVLQGLWDGLVRKQIADRLGISVSRVEAIMAQLRVKFQAKTTIELMRKAMQEGALTV